MAETGRAESFAVMGAGIMGKGIVQVLSLAGYPVALYDARDGVAAEVIREFEGRGAGAVRAADSVADAVADATIIVEAVSENLEVKHGLYAEIEATGSDALIASNTSTFIPSALASGLADPSRLLVAHFFNPANVVPLVELVPSADTDPAAMERVRTVLERAGKVPVLLAKERPGFVANRLQAAIVREAISLWRDGIATPEEIDAVMQYGLGPRWAAAGPFRVMDLGGLDVWTALTTQLFPTLATDQDVPPELAERAARGDLGAKSGRGFYDHDAAGAAATMSRVREHFAVNGVSSGPA